MSRTIGVFSVKGGVGKTTIAVNLACAMSKWFGKRCILIDTNINSAHVGLHFNLYEDSMTTVKKAMENGSLDNIHSVRIYDKGDVVNELKILPSSLKGGETFLGDHRAFDSFLAGLKRSYEYIIIDTSPGIEDTTMAVAMSIDEAIIVATPDIPTITDTLKTIEMLKKYGKRISGIVLNKISGKSYEVDKKEVSETCRCEVIVEIPEDKKTQESLSRGAPAVLHHPSSKFSKSIKRLAAHVTGEQLQESMLDKIKGIFSSKRPAIPSMLELEASLETLEKSDEQPIAEPHEEPKKDLKQGLMEEIARKLEKRLREEGV